MYFKLCYSTSQTAYTLLKSQIHKPGYARDDVAIFRSLLWKSSTVNTAIKFNAKDLVH